MTVLWCDLKITLVYGPSAFLFRYFSKPKAFIPFVSWSDIPFLILPLHLVQIHLILQFCLAWTSRACKISFHGLTRVECGAFLFLTVLWFSLLWFKECVIAKWVVFHVPLLQNRNLVCHSDCCFPCSHSVAAICILIFVLLGATHFWYLWQHALLFSMVRWRSYLQNPSSAAGNSKLNSYQLTMP